MNDATARRFAKASDPADALPPAKYRGVGGWLLVLCLMLTVVGPAISAWLMAEQYAHLAPRLAESMGLHLAMLGSLVLLAAAVGYGIFAGWQLWRVRPHAVGLAKRALLFGLFADIVNTALEVAATLPQDGDGRLLLQVEMRLIPSLVFFALCFAYLQRSKRVAHTFPE